MSYGLSSSRNKEKGSRIKEQGQTKKDKNQNLKYWDKEPRKPGILE
jgi:hypothetical protein